MKRINIITPYRVGGPWNWGKQLVDKINEISDEFQATHVYKLRDILLSPVWQKADIVHSVNPITFRLWQKPYLLTIKGNYKQESDNFFSRFYPKAIQKADQITVPSEYLKKELNISKAIVIPNAVNLAKFPLIEKVQKKTGEKITVLTVTKFYFQDKSQGVLNILESLEKIIKKDKLSIEYIVLGDGQHLEEIKAKAKKYCVNVKFEGFKNPLSYMQKADVFAYYSEHDNMPNAVLESMACGLPIIVNNIGAIPEMIEDNKSGLIANNQEEYYNKLSQVIKNKDQRVKLGKAARKRIEEKYSWEAIVQEWIKLYRALLK